MKKSFSRFITVALAVLMIVSLVSCASTVKKSVNTITGEFSGKTIILHSNDTHGNLEGFAYMPVLRDYFEANGATVIVVDDGDFSQGSVYVSSTKGLNAVKMLNAAGYDIVAFGNHEFDYGYDQLVSNLEEAEFEVVCADIFKDGVALFNTNTVVNVGDLRIGFFGLETPETLTKVNPGLIKGIDFAQTDTTIEHKYNLYDVAQKEVNKLIDKADVVICLAHLGVDQESLDKGCGSYDLYENVKGIDFVIDGHSHTVMTSGLKGERIQSTGTQFETIGVIVIDNASKKIVQNYLVDTTDLAKDADVLAYAQSIVADVDAEYGKVFANSEVALNGVKAVVRSQETNLGDLVADSMVWSVLSAGSIDVDDDHVVAMTNGGGIRANIEVGDVSMANVNAVLPFGNTIAVNYITGAELLEALEASTYCTPESVGGFPQVAGIEFTVDTTVAYDQGALYPESTYYGPASIKRVTINSINGKAFKADDVYAVITNNFCAAGGDTYYAFARAFNAGNGFDTAIPLDEALMDYISEYLGGTIGSSYAEPAGRITIKK